MRFWDSSALVPLLVDQQRSAELRGLPEEDIAVWWATEVECAAALRGGRAVGAVGQAGAGGRNSRSGPPPANHEARTRPGWGSRGPRPGRASSGWRGAATPGPAPVNR